MKKAYAIAILSVVIGGLNIGYMALFKKDLIQTVFGKNTLVSNFIFLCIGISALCIALYSDSYLPFLGPTVLPCFLLSLHTPDEADFEVKVLVKPGAKVLYWAAEPKNKDLQSLVDWRKAYVEFRNAGVTVADDAGFAVLKVRKPQPYTVPIKGELSPHIHYRVCQDEGMMGRVETVRLDGKEYFENVPAEFSNPQPPVEFVKPDQAISELNMVATNTLSKSVMEKENAFDESVKVKGADLNMAFLPTL